MPITLITGPANAGKAQLVMDAVRRELAHGLEPLLVVPTRADVEHYLRELAGERAAMGVRVLRFDGLIEEAAARAGVAGQSIGGLGRERLIEALAGGSMVATAAATAPTATVAAPTGATANGDRPIPAPTRTRSEGAPRRGWCTRWARCSASCACGA